ncbi:tetratricopeptide repeat protein [Hippea alviniae]|uniref:tetratricopeptide repeat protein n=1 Tax=Hippea alviniae TaxID=1279027 RepID=UPI0003B3E6E1|nr:tetratricopeptide repeat protein [Hippea alviniae]
MLKRWISVFLPVFVVFLLSFSAYAKHDSSFVVYHYTKGYVELYKGDFKSAADDLWLVFPYIIDKEFYNQLSDILVYGGQYDKAQKVLKKAIKVYPKEKEFYYKLFDIYTIEGKTKQAMEVMAKIKESFKKTPDTIKKLAIMYMKSSKYKKAYKILKYYVDKKGKNDASAHFLLANVCLKLKDKQCVLKESKMAYQLNKNVRYALFLAGVYEQFGMFDKAIEVYKKLPENAFIDYAIANDYYLFGDLKGAKLFYSKAFKLSKRVDYLEKLTFVDVRLKDYSEVVNLCKEYKKFVDVSDRLKLFCAVGFSRQSKYETALNLLSGINPKVPFYKDVVLNEIYCYFKMKDFRRVEDLLKSFGDVEMYFSTVGELYVKDGKFKDGIELLYDALKKAKDLKEKSNIYLYIADIYYDKLKDKSKTIETLKELLRINPNFAEGLNYLGYLYIDENFNVKEGVELVKKALKIDKNNPYYLDSLGWGYYRLKDYKKAEFYLKEALKGYKKSEKKSLEITLEHLLEVYLKENDRKEALKTAEEILKLNPNNKKAKKLLKSQ